MTTKYNPPSVDDTGPSFTSDEIYDSEVGKKFTEALEEQRIEKCFKDIKQVLVKYRCELSPYGNLVRIRTKYGNFEFYSGSDFNE